MLTVEKPIPEFLAQEGRSLRTPYYLIDESRLAKNLERIDVVRKGSGARAVLALKCFSTWAVFERMRASMDGTTSSSLYEARLGHEKFGGETHAYSVAWSEEELKAVRPFATKIIFNSISQLNGLASLAGDTPLGLRVNPGVSHSGFDLADPARKCSRLGVLKLEEVMAVADRLSGAMFHCQCENADFDAFERILNHIATAFAPLLKKLKWVSLGGGIYFTKDGYPLPKFIAALSEFSERFGVQVYLEPGEAAITGAGFLVTRVLDVVHNDMDIAIVDAAVETHMLDLLIYRTDAKIEHPSETSSKGSRVMIAGRTCLAGDVFGTYPLEKTPEVGSSVVFGDAAGYTMVKKNWFNGVAMPAIVVRRLDGRVDVVKQFSYEDYRSSLS